MPRLRLFDCASSYLCGVGDDPDVNALVPKLHDHLHDPVVGNGEDANIDPPRRLAQVVEHHVQIRRLLLVLFWEEKRLENLFKSADRCLNYAN